MAIVGPIQFRPLDVDAHGAVALRFREDSYRISFGEVEGSARFWRAAGEGGAKYLAWIRERQGVDPGYIVHAWDGHRVIGQIEMGTHGADASVAYVNLYYLVPEARGTGAGAELDRYVVEFLRAKGFRRALLSVAPTNLRAVRFYERVGWQLSAEAPKGPGVQYMERTLAALP